MNQQRTQRDEAKACDLSIRDAAEAGCICAVVRLPLPAPVENQAREHLLSNCPYAFCFRDISFDLMNGVLTLRGRVPSFYLKQILQTFLRDLAGVEQIDNQVDVVSATGLSSGPHKELHTE